MGRWGDGEMGKWGVGCGVWGVGCGNWGSGEVGKWGVGCGVWGVGRINKIISYLLTPDDRLGES
jgi:hypothetical protein